MIPHKTPSKQKGTFDTPSWGVPNVTIFLTGTAPGQFSTTYLASNPPWDNPTT